MRLPNRLLPLLQLTRMALVFTAIADSSCAYVLHRHFSGLPISPLALLFVVLLSVGLYGFGMSLNDIIDRRRDALTAAHRPLPSGRIGVNTAHIIAAALALLAIGSAEFYSQLSPALGQRPVIIVCFAIVLITFYDFAGKYLVAPGLLTLGLIRFFHAAIPAPHLPVLWQPLLLLNHVTLLSTVAYRWEQKRPPLTRAHWAFVVTSLVSINAIVILAIYAHRSAEGSFSQVMLLTPGLLIPCLAAAVFLGVAFYIRRSFPTPREAGQQLMLVGLLWLIVYDASFCFAYSFYLSGFCIAMLLPLAYLSVRTIRAWSKLTALSHRPEFKRA
ncbi:MAG TPA: UbiA family prenyltransferase [Tepidisphaeraceae bacterium]|jgi:hypothetical protein|nr:UbiA family prenyltransferase [Tepidisphaeraceae bacterium]